MQEIKEKSSLPNKANDSNPTPLNTSEAQNSHKQSGETFSIPTDDQALKEMVTKFASILIEEQRSKEGSSWANYNIDELKERVIVFVDSIIKSYGLKELQLNPNKGAQLCVIGVTDAGKKTLYKNF